MKKHILSFSRQACCENLIELADLVNFKVRNDISVRRFNFITDANDISF